MMESHAGRDLNDKLIGMVMTKLSCKFCVIFLLVFCLLEQAISKRSLYIPGIAQIEAYSETCTN